jgi:hypothetical protein
MVEFIQLVLFGMLIVVRFLLCSYAVSRQGELLNKCDVTIVVMRFACNAVIYFVIVTIVNF